MKISQLKGGKMETIEDMNGKGIKVRVNEGSEPNEYSLTIDFEGMGSLTANSYGGGGDFTLYSITPEALVNLAMGIIEAAAHAKSARELEAILAIKEVASVGV